MLCAADYGWKKGTAMNIGANIKAARKAAGVTQKELAERL